jgi:hypothetical protein
MAIKRVYIGSLGPFIWDDTDPVNDPDGLFPGETQKALVTDSMIFSGIFIVGIVRFNTVENLTIAAGVATGTGAAGRVNIDTQGGAVSDDLDSLVGYQDGDLVVIRCTSAARVVTVKNNSNFLIGSDFILNSTRDVLLVLNIGTDQWIQISRSSGG